METLKSILFDLSVLLSGSSPFFFTSYLPLASIIPHTLHGFFPYFSDDSSIFLKVLCAYFIHQNSVKSVLFIPPAHSAWSLSISSMVSHSFQRIETQISRDQADIRNK